MDFKLELSCAVLERTPAVLSALLQGLPDEWTLANDGPGTWSPYDVIGHLIHGERTDWIPRLRIILEHGTTRPFMPFDREAMFTNSRGKPLNVLLDEFAKLRADNISQLRMLVTTPGQYGLCGTHPAFGEVTLAQLLATWTAHDLNHIAQMSQTMSRQYKHAAGPWTAYIRVLQD